MRKLICHLVHTNFKAKSHFFFCLYFGLERNYFFLKLSILLQQALILFALSLVVRPILFYLISQVNEILGLLLQKLLLRQL